MTYGLGYGYGYDAGAAAGPSGAGQAGQGPVPCVRCGAAMTLALPEGAAHYGDTAPMRCDFCGATEVLTNESRVRLARERVAMLRMAQDAAEAPARAVDRLIAMRPWLGGLVVGAVMLLQGLGAISQTMRSIGSISTLDDQEKWRLIAQACVVPSAGIGIAVGMLVGWRIALARYRAALEPERWARPPLVAGGAARCRCCGGALAANWGAFVECAYCRTSNLLDHALLARREQLLRDETQLHLQRAAGVNARGNAAHAKFGRDSLVGALVGAVLFAGLGFAAAALLV